MAGCQGNQDALGKDGKGGSGMGAAFGDPYYKPFRRYKKTRLQNVMGATMGGGTGEGRTYLQEHFPLEYERGEEKKRKGVEPGPPGGRGAGWPLSELDSHLLRA